MSNADIVNDWFRTRLATGPVAAHTPAYNQVVDALPELIKELDAASSASATPAKSGDVKTTLKELETELGAGEA